MLIVVTTVASAGEGESLAGKIIASKLAACVQILPQMTSVYLWEGKVQKENEHLLLIKTLPEKYGELEKLILADHSYDVPEIAAIETSKVSARYAAWLAASLD